MKTALAVIACFLILPILAQPATAPSADLLLKGDLTFAAPDGWKMEGRTSDDRRVGYSHAAPKAVMVVNVDPQKVALQDSMAPMFAQQIIKNVRDNAAKNKLEMLMEP